jgi:hypothetical protein
MLGRNVASGTPVRPLPRSPKPPLGDLGSTLGSARRGLPGRSRQLEATFRSSASTASFRKRPRRIQRSRSTSSQPHRTTPRPVRPCSRLLATVLRRLGRVINQDPLPRNPSGALSPPGGLRSPSGLSPVRIKALCRPRLEGLAVAFGPISFRSPKTSAINHIHLRITVPGPLPPARRRMLHQPRRVFATFQVTSGPKPSVL